MKKFYLFECVDTTVTRVAVEADSFDEAEDIILNYPYMHVDPELRDKCKEESFELLAVDADHVLATSSEGIVHYTEDEQSYMVVPEDNN